MCSEFNYEMCDLVLFFACVIMSDKFTLLKHRLIVTRLLIECRLINSPYCLRRNGMPICSYMKNHVW